ncbi:MAG: DUF975 family protein [Kiritimatiellae bacterium]|nr:DUF975 family protein [Kiritimatiellia bacterium]
MDMYYAENGVRKGPIDEATFRSLVADGTIGPDTLVWHEGMTDWQPYARFQSQDPGSTPPSPPTPDYGPGACTDNGSLKRWAKEGLKGYYWTFIGGIIVWFLIMAAVTGVTGGIGVTVVQGIMFYGVANASLSGAYHRPITFNDFFIGFPQAWRAIGSFLLTSLFTFLWGLLFVIPGIIKIFSYAMTPFILLEHPDVGIMDAITESRRLMDGNKMRLFLFLLSFIGWWILASLTFGILLLWLIPYQRVSVAAFYRSVVREKGQPGGAAA